MLLLRCPISSSLSHLGGAGVGGAAGAGARCGAVRAIVRVASCCVCLRLFLLTTKSSSKITECSRGSRGGYPLAALGSEDWCNPVHGGVFSDGRPSVHGVAPSPTAPASSRVSRASSPMRQTRDLGPSAGGLEGARMEGARRGAVRRCCRAIAAKLTPGIPARGYTQTDRENS